MILGQILWSPKTGTQHRGAFVFPISYLIELEGLRFFRLHEWVSSREHHLVTASHVLGWFFSSRTGTAVGVVAAVEGDKMSSEHGIGSPTKPSALRLKPLPWKDGSHAPNLPKVVTCYTLRGTS